MARVSIAILFTFCFSGKVLSWEEDGFRSGMTIDEIRQRIIASGHILEKPRPGVQGAIYLHARSENGHFSQNFVFCNNSLTTYEKQPSGNFVAYVRILEVLIGTHGQPIIRATNQPDTYFHLVAKWKMNAVDDLLLSLVHNNGKSLIRIIYEDKKLRDRCK